MRALVLLIITAPVVYAQNVGQDARKEYINLVWNSNTPEELRKFLVHESLSSRFELNKCLNPFYLRGDFNGDKKLDYALAVVEVKSGKKGILIYHSEIQECFVVGAGTTVGYGDDYHWMDAWQVYPKRIVEQGVTELAPPKLKGEAILAQKLESSGGLIYWDGKGYRWYQQGD